MSAAHHATGLEAVTGLGDTEPGALDMLEHPAAVQARADMAMPRWFWHLAPVALVGAIALSAVWPWGFA